MYLCHAPHTQIFNHLVAEFQVINQDPYIYKDDMPLFSLYILFVRISRISLNILNFNAFICNIYNLIRFIVFNVYSLKVN